MNKTQIQHSLLLLLTAVIWGTAFVAQSVGMQYVGPMTYVCSRSIIGGMVLVGMMYWGIYLKGRDAKPEGTKVRKFDHVSRLPLFPYHHNIWKRCLNRRDSDTFYTI